MMKQRQKSKQSDVSYRKFEKHSDSDEEETLLLVRPTQPPRREIPTVNKEVEDGDTLQSLAIRYHCTIEELKRLNNIHRENEIFAKRTIKVPHRPFSSAMAGVHISGSSSPGEAGSPIDNETLNKTLVTLSNDSKVAEVNQIIFNSNIAKTSEAIEETPDGDDEEISLLPQEQVDVVEPETSRFDCSGADGDISLKALIACIIVVIFAVPLVYVFYIAEHPEQYHHHNS